jgi:DNA-binding transcriptional MocR family regulator
MFRYAAVAESLADLIARGLLQPGDRLPSVREIAESQHVSLSTAVQAYWSLEDRGLVETRARSGHYVRCRPERSIAPPREAEAEWPDNATTMLQMLQESVDDNVLSLGSVYPAAELLPLHRLNSLLASFARDTRVQSAAFDAPPGRFELRLQITRRLLRQGVAVSPEDIVITVGAGEAIHLCLAAVARAGDLVAVESPTSCAILHRIEVLGLRVLELPAQEGGAGAMLDVLRRAHLRTPVRACVLMPSFSNPGGSTMSEDDRKSFAAFTNDKEIPLVEDDVCGDLHFGARRPTLLKAFDRKNGVLLCSSFSKTLAPGYRVGWAVPGRFLRRVERLKLATSGATAVLPQLAIAEFLRKGRYARHLDLLRKQLAVNALEMIRVINESFPFGTRVAAPTGGTAMWVQLPDGANSLVLKNAALARGIGIAPGPVFSASGKCFKNFLRLGCGWPLTGRVEAAVRELGRLANEICTDQGAEAA